MWINIIEALKILKSGIFTENCTVRLSILNIFLCSLRKNRVFGRKNFLTNSNGIKQRIY